MRVSSQNPLVALTDLEEIAAQLSQQRFFMTPEQPLIQFISILPESEYGVEKKAIAMGETSTATRSYSRSGHGTRIYNLSRVRVEGKRTRGTLSWRMEEGRLAGRVIHRALVVVRRD